MSPSPFLLLGLWLGCFSPASAGAIYWTDRASGAKAIRRMGLDGAAPTTTTPFIALPPTADPRGVAVDVSAGKLYYGVTTQIVQTNLDGSSSAAKVSGLNTVRDLKLDRPSGYLYWADQGAGTLQRALTSNFIVTPSYAKTATDAYYLEIYRGPSTLNLPAILWGNSTGSYEVTGTDPTWITSDIIYTGGSNVRGIAVDAANQMVYWTEKDAAAVRRAKLTANHHFDLTTLVNLYAGLNAPHGVALDLVAQKIYWVDTGTNGTSGFGRSGVNRGDLDGNGAAEALIGPSSTNTFSSQPWDLDLDTRTTTYSQWLARFFRKDAALAHSSPTADPDQDGVTNLAEYAQGLRPWLPDADGQPAIRVVQNGGQSYPAVQFRRRLGATDLNYYVQVSNSLTSWQDNIHTPSAGLIPFTIEVSTTPVDDDVESVIVRSGKPLGLGGRQFLRVLLENF